MHPHISPVNPQARRRIPKTSHPPRTPSTRGARFLPLPTTSHTTNHESAPGCSFTTCHVRITSRRARTTPPHPVDASHPPEREEHPCTHAQTTSQHIEEHLPAHARGRITPRTGTLPTPHPHDSSHPSTPPLETSHIPSTPNADTLSGPSTPTSTQTLPPPPRTPPSEHAGARDMRARQTRAHGPGRHRRAPITPTSTTRTQTVTRAPPHPAPPPNMSLMSPRGTQGSHPLSTTNHPAPPSTQERHTTRTPPVENPTRTHSHRRPPKRSHHYTLLTSENPYPSATASPPPNNPTTAPPPLTPPEPMTAPPPHARGSPPPRGGHFKSRWGADHVLLRTPPAPHP